jgi:rhamnogalacturonyl hydrolase YesR
MSASSEVRQLTADRATKARARLENWIERNGWAGYDPYDIIGTEWYRSLMRAQSLPARAIRKVPVGLIHRYPLASRRLARLKAINPKGMGLFVAAFCRLFEANGNKSHLARAKECADWLLTNPSQGYPGLSWGYPFDWQSKVFIPRGTPSVVVSTAVGDGLWHLARLTGEAVYMDACIEICQFVLHGLNRTVIDNETLCFSYTPVDDFLVHNANLFAAEFLARIGEQTGQSDWCDIGIRAGNYALSEQNEDGSIFYWGRRQNEHALNHLDCYHSGFEIRCLRGLGKATEDARFSQAALKYFAFFHKAYIGDDGEVMTTPGVVYPVDIHSCAEALLCPATLSAAAPEQTLQIVSNVLPWILKLMQNEDGSFAYTAFDERQVDRTPYMRWGQAWMFRALAEIEFVFGSR